MVVRPAHAEDIPRLLQLQAENLFSQVPEAERSGGFVTTPYTAEQIALFLTEGLVFVAEGTGDALAGYVFAGPWDLYRDWDFFRYMISRFPAMPPFHGISITTTTTFQYGPVCIGAGYRGQGLLPQLFQAVCTAYAPRFAIGVTMINPWNERSLDAHTRKLGMAILDDWEFGGRPYHTLAFETRPGTV